jgi:transcriptional regulator with XRE-family HTH domain
MPPITQPGIRDQIPIMKNGGDRSALKKAMGRRVAAARHALGYGRTKDRIPGRDRFAEAAGVSESQIAKTEAGYQAPPIELLITLAQQFGIPESYIIRESYVGIDPELQERLRKALNRSGTRGRPKL